MKWHTYHLAALVAILMLGISVPAHAEVINFPGATEATALLQKTAQCPGGDCGANCGLARWLNANVADQKTFARSDCNGCDSDADLKQCKKLVAGLPTKFKCKRGGKKPPRVADTGKTNKPDKKPDKKPADNGKVDNSNSAAVATVCLTKEAVEELAKELKPTVTVDTTRFASAVDELRQSIDELKAKPDVPWGWIIFLLMLILNLVLLLYVAWPRLGPALSKLIFPPKK